MSVVKVVVSNFTCARGDRRIADVPARRMVIIVESVCSRHNKQNVTHCLALHTKLMIKI